MRAAVMARVALMAALTAVGAQISIPLPFTLVPFTLQVLMVVLAGLLLGARYGALSQVVYLMLGAIGLPVFAGFTGGLGHVVGEVQVRVDRAVAAVERRVLPTVEAGRKDVVLASRACLVKVRGDRVLAQHHQVGALAQRVSG